MKILAICLLISCLLAGAYIAGYSRGLEDQIKIITKPNIIQPIWKVEGYISPEDFWLKYE